MAHTTTVSLALLVAVPVYSQSIEITPNGSRPSGKGSAQNFTGTAVIDQLFAATDSSRVTVSHLTFEPGTRDAWHTHPAGQILIVTSGVGWVQEWSDEKRQSSRATLSGSRQG